MSKNNSEEKIPNGFVRGFRKFSLNIHKGIDKSIFVILILVVTAAAIIVRYISAPFPTNDLVGIIINGWMKGIENVGFSNFYKVDADYSPLYLFMIALFTKLPKGELVTINNYTFYLNDMYYIKSVFFLLDLLNAIAIGLIVRHISRNNTLSLIAYMLFLILPVQFMNSALWGNCDSMYFFCFIYALLFVLKKKDWAVWFMFGLAMSLKLQAVFILPFLFYLVFSRRLKFYPIIFAPIAVLLSFVPAYICGASFVEPFTFFSKQIGGYSQLTLGCANFWKFFGVRNMDKVDSPLNKASPYIGLLMIFVFTAIVYLRKIKLTDENIVYTATFLIGLVPFFLPHMHERYFYSLDVLVVIYALIKKKRYYLIPLMQLSSFIAYYHYLSGFSIYFIDVFGEDSVSIAAIINAFVLTMVFNDLMKLEHLSRKEALEAIEEEKKRLDTIKVETEEERKERISKESLLDGIDTTTK